MKTITAKKLKEKIDSGGDFILVDVLSKESFDSKHIPKSVSIPVSEIEERAERELKDKGKEVIVYCASKTCNASPNAAKKLEALGYKNVVDFEDGLDGWNEAGFEFEGSSI